MATAIEEIRQSMTPLNETEIGALLEQEYGEFRMKLQGPDGNPVSFTVRELSISNEKRIVKTIKTAVGPVLKVVGSAKWTAMAGASQLEFRNHLRSGELDGVRTGLWPPDH